MATLQQLLRAKSQRRRKVYKSKTTGLQQCPQKRGTCLKVFKESPKKPNSAKRRVAKVLLSNDYSVRAQIPGEGHNLQRYKKVLIRGGRVRDLPGVRYRVVRGVYDCLPVYARRKGASKLGLKSRMIAKLKQEALNNAS